jgi:type IV secretion system protein VirB11
LATIHANDAAAGLIRLAQLCAEATTVPQQGMIAEVIDLAVFINRTPDGRRVEEICSVQGWDRAAEKFLTSTLTEEDIRL